MPHPFEDHRLTSQAAVERFRTEHGVATTPQVFAGGERIGGYSDLARRLGVRPLRPGGRSYLPVIAVFTTAALIALALGIGPGASWGWPWRCWCGPEPQAWPWRWCSSLRWGWVWVRGVC